MMNLTPAMWTPGPLELVIILVIAVLLFGRKLPEIARSMGKSITEFKKGIKDTEDDLHKTIDESDKIADDYAKKDKSPSREPEDA